jgi:PAS domain S-box-containing protein
MTNWSALSSGNLVCSRTSLANKAKFEELRQMGYALCENLPLETKDGQRLIVEFVTTVYQAGDRNVVQCNVRDTTRRRKAEVAASRLAAIVESSNDAIVGKDLDGIITDWNKGAERIFGFTSDEMVGTSVLRLIPVDRQHEEGEIMAKIKRGETLKPFETLRQTKDGRSIHMSVAVSPIKESTGRVVGYSKVARDISESKAVEERIRQLNLGLEQRVAERTTQLQSANQELHVANEELDAFNFSVSHDLRAPLRRVLGFIDLLQADAGPLLSEESLRYLKTISKVSKQMDGLIEDLLAFSHLGKSEIKKREVDLDRLVEEAKSDFQADTRERHIDWQIHALGGVLADRSLLRLVFVNLISNALKFTRARLGAKIEIGCAPSNPGEKVIFIRDNGAGFDPRHAGKLFGVFSRLHSSEEFEGTGIGLANVRTHRSSARRSNMGGRCG